MENNIVGNKRTRTKLLLPLEIKNYMILLGATLLNDSTFILDGLKCGVKREDGGVYFYDDIPETVYELFKKYNMSSSIFKQTVFDLEGLLLLHMYLCGDDIEEAYVDNLYNIRKELLLQVISESKNLTYDGLFKDFDDKMTPFLHDNFDIDKFLAECIFNTTGYYEKDEWGRSLKFEWKTKEDTDTIYTFGIYGDTFWDSVIMKTNDVKSQMSRVLSDGVDIIKNNDNLGNILELDLMAKTVKVGTYSGYLTVRANDDKIQGVLKLSKSFQCKTKTYEKEKEIAKR